MIRKTIVISTLVMLLLSSSALARTYKIGIVPWAGFSPTNVAEAKGFWKAYGLDVKVITYFNNVDLNQAFANKAVEIADDMMGSWIGLYMEGIPITIIGELDWSHGGDKIVVKKDFDIARIKGQQIGVYLNNPAVLFFLNQYLTQNGIRLSDVKPIEIETEALSDNFIADRFSVMVNYDPQALRAERNGNGRAVATSATYPGCIPEGYVIRSDVFSKIPEKDIVNICRGWIDAVRWIGDASNWPEFKTILNKKTFERDDDYSDDDLKKMMNGVRIHDVKTLKERNGIDGGLLRWLKELRIMLKDNNMLRKDFNPEEMFNNKPLMEALKHYQQQ